MRTNINTVQKTRIPVSITANSATRRSTLTVKKMHNLAEIERDKQIGLCLPAHLSMVMILKGKGTSTDWWNVAFRVSTAYHAARKEYSKETIEQLKEAVDAVMPTLDETHTGKVMNIQTKHVGLISEALLAADQIQQEVSRPTLIFAAKKAKATVEIYACRAMS